MRNWNFLYTVQSYTWHISENLNILTGICLQIPFFKKVSMAHAEIWSPFQLFQHYFSNTLLVFSTVTNKGHKSDSLIKSTVS